MAKTALFYVCGLIYLFVLFVFVLCVVSTAARVCGLIYLFVKQNKPVNPITNTSNSGDNTQNNDQQNKQVNQSTDTGSSGYNTQNKIKKTNR
jgi:hypothetical protein